MRSLHAFVIAAMAASVALAPPCLAEAYKSPLENKEDPLEGTYTWKITDFGNLQDKKVYSDNFTIGGYKWRLLTFPRGNQVDYMSLYLDVADSNELPYNWNRSASFTLSVINEFNADLTHSKVASHLFNSKESDWGWTQFLSLEDLYGPQKGFLVDDAFTIEAKVKVRTEDNYFSYDSKKETGHVGLKNHGAKAYKSPESTPVEFHKGEPLEVYVNSVYSNVTAVTYDYYSFPFCSHHEGKARVDESLGEWFLGNRIRGAPFSFTFLTQEDYVALCEKQIGVQGFSRLKNAVDEHYRVRMTVDNLPLTRLSIDKFFQMIKEYGENAILDTVDDSFSYIGYAIGGREKKESGPSYYLNNHITISVLYADVAPTRYDVVENLYNVVGFQVLPCSVSKEVQDSETFDPRECTEYPKQYVSPGTSVQYSYSVFFEKTDISWSDRWMPFLHVRGKPMHESSLSSWLFVTLVFLVWPVVVLVRLVRWDKGKQEQTPFTEDLSWKLIGPEVFRAPPMAGALTACIGAGVQVSACLFFSLTLMALGLASPVMRGGFLGLALLSYPFFGVLGGYAGVKMHVNINRSSDGWKQACLGASLFLPGIAFPILTILSVVLSSAGRSSQVVPFCPTLLMVLLWVLLSIPLAFVGGYFASKTEPAEHPEGEGQVKSEAVKTPEKASFLPFLIALGAGLFPFGVMYVDLYFIFSAMFEHLYYYAFGFLFGMTLIAATACIEMSVVSALILCIEGHNWWWRSFLVGGSSALYFVLFGLCYLIFDSGLEGSLSIFVFLCYLSIMATIVCVSMGALSFGVSYALVRRCRFVRRYRRRKEVGEEQMTLIKKATDNAT